MERPLAELKIIQDQIAIISDSMPEEKYDAEDITNHIKDATNILTDVKEEYEGLISKFSDKRFKDFLESDKSKKERLISEIQEHQKFLHETFLSFDKMIELIRSQVETE